MTNEEKLQLVKDFKKIDKKVEQFWEERGNINPEWMCEWYELYRLIQENSINGLFYIEK